MESLRPSRLAWRKSRADLAGSLGVADSVGRKESFSIALVPVKFDQVPDLHAAPEGGRVGGRCISSAQGNYSNIQEHTGTFRKLLKRMAGTTGLEPATSDV